MSHFSTLVIRKDGNPVTIADAMERYWEGRESEPRIYKTREEIIKESREALKEEASNKRIHLILTEHMEKNAWIVAMREESIYSCYSDEEIEDLWKDSVSLTKLIEKQRDGSIIEEELHKYGVKVYGYTCDKEGNALTAYNPESKWDWMSIGGRWEDALILKPAAAKRIGRDRVNHAAFKDIDWGEMYSIPNDEREKAELFWEYYVLETPYPGTKEELEEKIGPISLKFYKPEYYLTKHKTFDDYIESLSHWCTHAVVDGDGEWHERGSVGWFGTLAESEDEEAKDDWGEMFYQRFIKNLDPNDEITIVDCHI